MRVGAAARQQLKSCRRRRADSDDGEALPQWGQWMLICKDGCIVGERY